MSDDSKRPWYTQLPAKMAAVVVFLVAITTLVGNVMNLVDKRRAAASEATSPAPTEPATTTTTSPAWAARAAHSDKFRLQLDRIIVQSDGSIRTTDWRFSVEADGQPVFVVQQDEMDDSVGRNVVLPEDAATAIRLAPGQRANLMVKGWRGSRLRIPGTEPDVRGEGVVAAAGAVTPIRVSAGDLDAGAFVFYFSVAGDE